MTPDEWDEEERQDAEHEVRATTKVAGYVFLVLIALAASVLTLVVLHLWPSLTGPSSVPSRQDVQIGTVCPDVTGGAS